MSNDSRFFTCFVLVSVGDTRKLFSTWWALSNDELLGFLRTLCPDEHVALLLEGEAAILDGAIASRDLLLAFLFATSIPFFLELGEEGSSSSFSDTTVNVPGTTELGSLDRFSLAFPLLMPELDWFLTFIVLAVPVVS